MYKFLDAFQKDVALCGNTYYDAKSLQPNSVNTAYEIYRNAVNGTNLGITIVGRLALLKDGRWISSNPDFPSIDEILKQNLGTMDENAGSLGCVLDTGNWSLLANDAWLLGSIHAVTEIHFASPLSWTNLWNEAERRMTVTAREVIGITSMGYKIERPAEWAEAVATCIDVNVAQQSSLLTYKTQVERYVTSQNLQQFFQTAIPLKATSYRS